LRGAREIKLKRRSGSGGKRRSTGSYRLGVAANEGHSELAQKFAYSRGKEGLSLGRKRRFH